MLDRLLTDEMVEFLLHMKLRVPAYVNKLAGDDRMTLTEEQVKKETARCLARHTLIKEREQRLKV